MPMFADGLEKTSNPVPVNTTGTEGPFFKPSVQLKEDGATPQQAQPPGWNSNMLSILSFDDSYNGNCFGNADLSGNAPLSSCLKWPSCRQFSIPLSMEYYIDRITGPHAQPLNVTVSIRITFTPNGGAEKVLYNATDAAPVYKGANIPLAPSFGKKFPVNIDTDGTLSVKATLHDALVGTDVVYSDTKSFVILCS